MKRFIVWGGLLYIANSQAAQHYAARTQPCGEYPRGTCQHCQAHRAHQLILTKEINCYVNVLQLVKDLEISALRHENRVDGAETTEGHSILCNLYARNIDIPHITQRLKSLLDELNQSVDDSSSSSSSSSSSPSGSTVVYYSSSSSSASTLPSAIPSSETVAGLLSHDDLRNGTSHGPLAND